MLVYAVGMVANSPWWKIVSKTGGETDAASRSPQSLVSRRHPETFIARTATSIFVGFCPAGPASVFIGAVGTKESMTTDRGMSIAG